MIRRTFLALTPVAAFAMPAFAQDKDGMRSASAAKNVAPPEHPRLVAGQGWQRGGGGAMDLHLTGGRVLRAEVANARGCPARPLGEGELVGKFIDCASRAKVPPADPAALAERILRLEQCEDVGALFA